MSTFLELCADLRQEATDSGTGPVTVIAQTGELGRFVKWIKDGYFDLQQSRDDWLWLRSAFTVNTVAGTDAYAYGDCTDTGTSAAITRFARWYDGYDVGGFPYFTSYLSSSGVGSEIPLIPLPWDAFHRIYKVGVQNNGAPGHFSIDPAMRFVLGPKPDDVYVVQGSYQKSPQTLALDADVPEMPTRFHRLITYFGLSRYGGNRVAPEAMLRAAEEGGKLLAALELNQLPSLSYADPLA